MRALGPIPLACALVSCVSLGAQTPTPKQTPLPSHPDRFPGVTALLETSVANGAFPGAVAVVGWRDTVVYTRAVGRYGIDDARPVTDSTIYDLASLTKVIGLTTAVMLLTAEGAVDVDAPVVRYLPQFRGPGKEHVTIRHLLTHSSGLPAWRPLHLQTDGRDAALDTVLATPLEAAPGERYAYSDLGAITLGLVVERVSGARLDTFLHDRVFEPLGMRATRYRPPAEWRHRIAPTEQDPWRGRLIRGEVHDENAARLGGVAGHAGLFGTAPDLARFASWLLDAYHGRLDDRAGINLPQWVVREFTHRQPGPAESTRALGWDTPSSTGGSAGTLMSRASFGHTGFTGTSIWIDPLERLYVILLTNRVHPTRQNTAIRRIRGMLADSVVTAITNR